MEVTAVQFENVERALVPTWTIRVRVEGEGFEMRAMPLVARVGDAEVEGILIGPDEDVFFGFLEQEPQPGAVLHVGFADEELLETTFSFQPPIV